MRNIVMTTLLTLTLAIPFQQTTYAMGSKPPATQQPPGTGSSNDTMLKFALNLAIVYAKSESKYNQILTTLGINTADDLLSFLKGNGDGSNFRNIIARLAFLQAQKDPKVKEIFEKLGIKNEQDLRRFLSGSEGGINFETILQMALVQAQANPKYSVWLNRLNIRTVDDLKRLISGNGSQGNLQSLILVVALHYVESKPKYAKYVPYIQLAMAMVGLSPGGDGTGDSGSSDDDIIDLGAYSGMTVGETKAIRNLK